MNIVDDIFFFYNLEILTQSVDYSKFHFTLPIADFLFHCIFLEIALNCLICLNTYDGLTSVNLELSM